MKKEEARKTLENKNKELMDKNEKLMKQLTCQLPIQGSQGRQVRVGLYMIPEET